MSEKTADKPPAKRTRMSADERKASIIEAVIPIFAEHGFAGTTTKDLAKAAGVSEALLYRHFPSKESIYHYLQDQICDTNSAIHTYVFSLPYTTETIIKLVYLVFRIIYRQDDSHPMDNAVPRLMVQSLLESGEFTKSFHEPRFNLIVPIIEESAKVAVENGDLIPGPLSHAERHWFPHHLALSLRLSELPQETIFEYESKRSERMIHAVWFSLRGLGIKDEVIERLFKPEDMEPEIDEVLYHAGLIHEKPEHLS